MPVVFTGNIMSLISIARALAFSAVISVMLIGYGVSAFVAIPGSLLVSFAIQVVFKNSDDESDLSDYRGLLRHINDLRK